MRKSRPLRRSFSSEIFYQTIERSDAVIAKIIGHPLGNSYEFYIVVEAGGITKFKLWVYSLETAMVEAGGAFFKLRWKDDNELLISIPSKHVEITVFVNEAKATVRDLKRYITPPFEMSRTRAMRTTM